MGPMNVMCRFCHAFHWDAEKLTSSTLNNVLFGGCCNSGKTTLPALLPPPVELSRLLEGTEVVHRRFREHIRQYNAALAFTSVGAKLATPADARPANFRLHARADGLAPPAHGGGAPWVYQVQGQLVHRLGPLEPDGDQPRTYAQLIVIDTRLATDQRMQHTANQRLDAEVMRSVASALDISHPYYQVYRTAHQMLRAQEAANPASSNLHVALSFRASNPAEYDPRTYRAPTADEIAVLIPEGPDAEADRRDIRLYLRSGGLRHISELDRAYHPLAYPLLFPNGEPGWHLDIPNADGTRTITQMQYAAYRLHPRRGEPMTLFYSGRLFQQYMCDFFAMVRQGRLNWLRNNQATLRAELYSGVQDAFLSEDVQSGADIGARYILPATYTGSPRYMFGCFQDSMAITRHFKKISFFVTMTANPQWKEVQENLLPGQTAADRPDLIARVFEQKKKALITLIFKVGVLGNAVAYVYTVEFQKRGLPHVHLLVFLRHEDNPATPEDIDAAVRAYFPDEQTEPELFRIVKAHMLHGPCGERNPRAVCMVDGRCEKHYPRQFSDVTMVGDDSYPTYKRPNDGRTFLTSRGHTVDNRDVVPYNPFLSLALDCHINVEICGSIRSLKYIHKYIHKGSDRASARVYYRDEISAFIDASYFSASESAMRLFHNDLHEIKPSVMRLALHLENQQTVVFDPDQPLAEIAANAAKDTTLTGFFKTCAESEHARQYLYHEFPQHYTWTKSTRTWHPRRAAPSIGRVHFASPSAGERFYLRLLLSEVRGPQSFADLRTVDGRVHPTFKEACLALGLLEDDNEWHAALQQAKEVQTGHMMRNLFVSILVNNAPSRPPELWEQFKDDLTDDLRRALRRKFPDRAEPWPSQEVVYDYGLYLIREALLHHEKVPRDFQLPEPVENWGAHVHLNRLIGEQLQFDGHDQQSKAEANIAQLNLEQRAAFDEVMQSVEQRSGQPFFLSGPGGTGKTFVYLTLCYALRGAGKIVLCVASSGIAALLLPLGRTSHSTLKLPIPIFPDSFLNIKKNTMLWELLKQVALVIWDESAMQHRFCFETADRSFRDLLDCDRPFGGVTVVFGGDFQQIPPVVVRGGKADIINASLRRSSVWPLLKILRLTQNMRVNADEIEWAQWLLDTGHGRNMDNGDMVQLPAHMNAGSTLEDLVSAIYPAIDTRQPPQYFADRTILSPHNATVDQINNDILRRYPGEVVSFLSADSATDKAQQDDDAAAYSSDYLNSINLTGLPLHKLSLKIGCPVMILRNIDPQNGLCNGTRGVVTRATSRLVEIQIVGGEHHGQRQFIPRITLSPSDTALPFILKRRQFPLRLAFAMTINKSQGQSVRWVGLDLRVPVFAHGQLYVALSRCTSGHRVKVLLPEDSNMRTKNIVWQELLLPNE